jgi:hypothetical protein
MWEISIPNPRLGASDCRCPAHFFRFDGDPATLQHPLQAFGFSLYRRSPDWGVILPFALKKKNR